MLLPSRFVVAAIAAVMSLSSAAISANPCLTASAGTAQWQSAPIRGAEPRTSQPGLFTIEFEMNAPAAGSDTLLALAQGPQTDWRGLAAIVRFNSNNTIDVRDGDVYRADQVMVYNPGKPYVVRFEVDVPAKRYSVYAFEGYSSALSNFAREKLLAKDYTFRTEQQGVSQLDTMVVEAEIGSLNACQIKKSNCLAAIPGAAQWQNAEASSYGSATVHEMWFVTPTAAGSDALLALTQGPQYFWTGLAAILRFNANNTIDARNGDRYMAESVLPYEPNRRYKVDMIVWSHSPESTAPRQYTVSVTPEGGPRTTIADRYSFRTEQPNPNSLDNWTLEASEGGVKACYMWYE